MNILMLTNTFTPHVGGVARSVAAFTAEYRRRGHRVVVVAPTYQDMPKDERDVVRVPALQNFNGSDFSVPVPILGFLSGPVEELKPDVVHSHHPFLLGDTALRISASSDIPVVFTHHSQYERYTHYVPGDSALLRRFAVDLATGYCDLCDAVIAPSETIAKLLHEHGVKTRIEVIPTGVDLAAFDGALGAGFRRSRGIPEDALVVGHLGRLAEEKNLDFLFGAVAQFLEGNERAWFLVVGVGPMEKNLRELLANRGPADRLDIVGILPPEEIKNAYQAMDVFAFASQSETQGMVLTEAMAAGVPVVAIDAPGVREVLRDGENGRMLMREDVDDFVAALTSVTSMPLEDRQAMQAQARATAEELSMPRCAARELDLYAELIEEGRAKKAIDRGMWATTLRRIEEEYKIWANVAEAAGDAITGSDADHEAGE